MSDTPETDAAVISSNGQWSFVLKETCRRIERERNEARKKYDTLATEHMLVVNKLYEERDEAREVIRNIVWAGRVGRQWQNYAIEFLEKLEETK